MGSLFEFNMRNSGTNGDEFGILWAQAQLMPTLCRHSPLTTILVHTIFTTLNGVTADIQACSWRTQNSKWIPVHSTRRRWALEET